MLDSMTNDTAGSCPRPLLPTEDTTRFYPGFPSCGMACKDPFIDADDQLRFNIVTTVLTVTCIICNIFGMVSLFLKLYTVKLARFSPDKCVLYMNISFLLSSFGYLLPLFPNMRSISTCTEDGLRQFLTRHSDYTSPRTGMCLLTFCLTFVFTLSGLVWFGHLMFACYLDFQKIINSHKKTKAVMFTLTKSSFVFFHGTAFLIPVIMAIAVIFLQSVEGNNVLGVCWIRPGHTAKTIFYLAQFTIILAIVLVFILLYWWNLRKAQLGQFGTLKTQRNALRRLRVVGIMCMAILVFHVVQLAGIWIRIDYDQTWNDALEKSLRCQKKNLGTSQECQSPLEAVRPSYLAAHYLMVISYFSTGILISAWTWNLASFRRWKKLLVERKLNGHTVSGNVVHADHLQDGQAANPLLMNGVSARWGHDQYEMQEQAKRFQRTSIVPGKKISSVADFDPERKLENWVEDARHLRISRRKSDAGNCCCSKASTSRLGMPHSHSRCVLSVNGHSDLHLSLSKPREVKESDDSGGFISF